MTRTYFINGWRYGRSYFYGVRSWSINEIERMEAGEVIEKDGDLFWIKTEE